MSKWGLRHKGVEILTPEEWNKVVDALEELNSRVSDLEMLRKQVLKEGTITADGTEQVVIEITELMNIEGYIDLSNLASGDTVIIRIYVKVKDGGDYEKHAEETYSGAQTLPLLFIQPRPAKYGLKITLQQTAGTYRNYDYQFFKVG